MTYIPNTEEEFAEMVAHNKAIGESCLNLTGPLLGIVDTTSVVHDLEVIRLALDEGKVNYLGISHGSQLGMQYAELYPVNIRVIAPDGTLTVRNQRSLITICGMAHCHIPLRLSSKNITDLL